LIKSYNDGVRRFLTRRGPADLVLDLVFAAWVLNLVVTGHLLPPIITELLSNDSPIVAVSEPDPAPPLLIDESLPEA
jgi:hypothetical protein